MNWVASTDFPVPQGPATSRLSPTGMPPPSIASSSGMPIDMRWQSAAFSVRPVRPKVRGNACRPARVMRKVWSPGTEACPRNFMICILRTIEFRSTCW